MLNYLCFRTMIYWKSWGSEYDQNTLYEVLKELIKAFIKEIAISHI